VLVRGKPFQSSQMFVGKAWSLPLSGALEKVFQFMMFWPHLQTLD